MGLMEQHPLGKLWPVSTLTLGGGGLGMVWGETTFEECVATVHARSPPASTCSTSRPATATARPRRSSARRSAAGCPDGVRVTSKCNLGNPPPEEIAADPAPVDRRTACGGCSLSRLDLFFLHSNVVPDARLSWRGWGDAASRMTPYDVFVPRQVQAGVRDAGGEGLIGAWGLTGIGHPDTIIRLLGERAAPAAVQCIANLLGLAGRAEVLRRAGEAARDHGGGARPMASA